MNVINSDKYDPIFETFCINKAIYFLNLIEPYIDETLLPNNQLLPNVQNVVSTMFTDIIKHNGHINLKDIISKPELCHAKRCATNFAAMIIKSEYPSTTALIFSNGKIVCVGAKGPEPSTTALQLYRLILDDQGYRSHNVEIKFYNRVVSGEVDFPIDIKKMRNENELNCLFMEDLFPGLVYIPIMGGGRTALVLIFSSGKVIIMGIKDEKSDKLVFDDLRPILYKYKKETLDFNNTKKDHIPDKDIPYTKYLEERVPFTKYLKEKNMDWFHLGNSEDVAKILNMVREDARKDKICKEKISLAKKYLLENIISKENISELLGLIKLKSSISDLEQKNNYSKIENSKFFVFINKLLEYCFSNEKEEISINKGTSIIKISNNDIKSCCKEEINYILLRKPILNKIKNTRNTNTTFSKFVLENAFKISFGLNRRILIYEDLMNNSILRHPLYLIKKSLEKHKSIDGIDFKDTSYNFEIKWKDLTKKTNILVKHHFICILKKYIYDFTCEPFSSSWFSDIKTKLGAKYYRIWCQIGKSKDPITTLLREILAVSIQNTSNKLILKMNVSSKSHNNDHLHRNHQQQQYNVGEKRKYNINPIRDPKTKKILSEEEIYIYNMIKYNIKIDDNSSDLSILPKKHHNKTKLLPSPYKSTEKLQNDLNMSSSSYNNNCIENSVALENIPIFPELYMSESLTINNDDIGISPKKKFKIHHK